MNVIDAHHHVWDLSVRDQNWITGPEMAPIRRSFSLDDLRPDARAAGVTATVLVQTLTVAEETPEMLALAAADPLVAAVVGWTDLTSPGIADELEALAEGAGGEYLAGIRHQVQSEPDPDWLRRPDVIRGLRAVAAARLCYDLVVRPHQLPAATYAAAAVPELTMVLDHAAKPSIAAGDLGAGDLGAGDLGPWAEAIRAFAARPNTVCKLSGLVSQAAPGAPESAFVPVADVILSAFGPHRVMFGSDWPVCLLAADYPDVISLARSLTAGLAKAERTAVFASTAARIYQIDVSGQGAAAAGGGTWLLPTRRSRRSSR
jgi:L-fuconolactonase